MRFFRWLGLALGLRREFSDGWFRDQQRREFSNGIDQSCIDWDAMKRRQL